MYKGNYKGPQKFNDGRNSPARRDSRGSSYGRPSQAPQQRPQQRPFQRPPQAQQPQQQPAPSRKPAPRITSIAGKEAEEVFPMRLNKFLASRGQGSRREVDRMISQGQIFINAKRAVLGDKVNEDDVIEFKYRGKL